MKLPFVFLLFFIFIPIFGFAEQSSYSQALLAKNLQYVTNKWGQRFSVSQIKCDSKKIYRSIFFQQQNLMYVYHYKNGKENILGFISGADSNLCKTDLFFNFNSHKIEFIKSTVELTEMVFTKNKLLKLFSKKEKATSVKLPEFQVGHIFEIYAADFDGHKTELVLTRTPSTFHTSKGTLPVLERLHTDLGFSIEKFIYLSQDEFLLFVP